MAYAKNHLGQNFLVGNRLKKNSFSDYEGKFVKLFVASSWQNEYQQDVVAELRANDYEVYDFKKPAAGNDGLHWSEVDGGWESWSSRKYREALKHPVAEASFKSDFDAMKWADMCVLVLPCGISAHLEAGYMAGQGKPVYVLILEQYQIELMYLLCGSTCIMTSMEELLTALGSVPSVELI